MAAGTTAITFSGRRYYTCVLLRQDSDSLTFGLTPTDEFGAYPAVAAADETYRQWCRANASDPVVDEVLAETYRVAVSSSCLRYVGDVSPLAITRKERTYELVVLRGVMSCV